MLGKQSAVTDLPVILAAQIELLEGLIDLGRQQLDAIKQGRMNELLNVLKRRQESTHRLVANARWLGLRSNDALAESQCHAYRKQRALAVVRFDELLELEASCERLLRERREQISQPLRHMLYAVSVAAAYGETVATTQGGSLDLSSSG